MRAYHFVGAVYGIQNIVKRRLKIATLRELNDPFEFFGADLGDPVIRRNLAIARETIADKVGLLCFSNDWRNPVLWGHYADRHRGVCLGFEVTDEAITAVKYVGRRFSLRPDPLKTSGAPDQDSVLKLMLTKYVHWRYERELRAFAPLRPDESEGGVYFSEFGPRLKLTSVIVGALSALSRDEVLAALGSLEPEVEVFKARLAFRSFRVVRQHERELW